MSSKLGKLLRSESEVRSEIWFGENLLIACLSFLTYTLWTGVYAGRERVGLDFGRVSVFVLVQDRSS